MRTIEDATIHTLRMYPEFGVLREVKDLTDVEYVSIISFRKDDMIIKPESADHIEQLKKDVSIDKVILTIDIKADHAHIPLMFLGCEYLLVTGQDEAYRRGSEVIMQHIQKTRTRKWTTQY